MTLVILVLGSSTSMLRDVFLAEITSNGSFPIGGSKFRIDLRIGYLGPLSLDPRGICM
jgi:hypothetical protein